MGRHGEDTGKYLMKHGFIINIPDAIKYQLIKANFISSAIEHNSTN